MSPKGVHERERLIPSVFGELYRIVRITTDFWVRVARLTLMMILPTDAVELSPPPAGAPDPRSQSCDCESVAPWNDYFVRPSGNDAHSGRSPELAWQTLGKLSSRKWLPGDRIRLEGGAVFDGAVVFAAEDRGSAIHPITLMSFGHGRATIRCGAGSAITIRNTGAIAIRNLVVQGPGNTDGWGHHGIHLRASDPNGTRFGPIELSHLEISGFFQNGIYVESTHTSDPGFQELRVEHCAIHDNGLNGFSSLGVFRGGGAAHFPHKNFTIRDCRVYNNTGQPAWPSHSGSGIQLAFVDGAIIEYCEAYNNGALNDACGGPVGIWAWEANNVVIQHNESHHNWSRSGCDGGGFDLDGGVTNSVMQYNYSHDNVGAGFGLFQFEQAHAFHNNIVRYNISQNEGMGGIHLWATNSNGGIRDTVIHNNTLYVGRDQEGGIVETDIGTSFVSDTRVYNNIVISAAGRPVVSVAHPNRWTFRANAYYDASGPARFVWEGVTYLGLAAWQSASGQETNLGIEGHPRMTGLGTAPTMGAPRNLATLSNYRLEAGSPLIDAGCDVVTEAGIAPGARDFFGTAIPADSRHDIGAHEFSENTEGHAHVRDRLNRQP